MVHQCLAFVCDLDGKFSAEITEPVCSLGIKGKEDIASVPSKGNKGLRIEIGGEFCGEIQQVSVSSLVATSGIENADSLS